MVRRVGDTESCSDILQRYVDPFSSVTDHMFYSDSVIRSQEPFLFPQDLPVVLSGYYKLVLAYFL
jgi:hypothetical protein